MSHLQLLFAPRLSEHITRPACPRSTAQAVYWNNGFYSQPVGINEHAVISNNTLSPKTTLRAFLCPTLNAVELICGVLPLMGLSWMGLLASLPQMCNINARMQSVMQNLQQVLWLNQNYLCVSKTEKNKNTEFLNG